MTYSPSCKGGGFPLNDTAASSIDGLTPCVPKKGNIMKKAARVIFILLLASCCISCARQDTASNTPRPVSYQLSEFTAPNGRPDVIVARASQGNTGRFPDVTRTSDGLLAAFYWNNIDTHAPAVLGDAVGTIMMTRGRPSAAYWENPVPLITQQVLEEAGLGVWFDADHNLYYDKRKALAHDAKFAVDARDPNLTTLNDGTLIMTFFTRVPVDALNLAPRAEKDIYQGGRAYIMYSKNDGYDWSAPVEIPSSYLDVMSVKRGDIAVYRDGTFLIPLYGYNSQWGDTVYTTANVLARLEDRDGQSEIVFLEEYSSHQFEDRTEGAFALGDNEVSFGVSDQGVTYALCRPSGNVLCSSDQGKNWILIGSNRDDDQRDTQQPSFCKIHNSRQFFVSWSETTGPTSRNVFGKLFDASRSWNAQGKNLLYENDKGDMADPSSIYLENGRIFTIFYDVGEQCIGGVFHDLEVVS